MKKYIILVVLADSLLAYAVGNAFQEVKDLMT